MPQAIPMRSWSPRPDSNRGLPYQGHALSAEMRAVGSQPIIGNTIDQLALDTHSNGRERNGADLGCELPGRPSQKLRPESPEFLIRRGAWGVFRFDGNGQPSPGRRHKNRGRRLKPRASRTGVSRPIQRRLQISRERASSQSVGCTAGCTLVCEAAALNPPQHCRFRIRELQVEVGRGGRIRTLGPRFWRPML